SLPEGPVRGSPDRAHVQCSRIATSKTQTHSSRSASRSKGHGGGRRRETPARSGRHERTGSAHKGGKSRIVWKTACRSPAYRTREKFLGGHGEGPRPHSATRGSAPHKRHAKQIWSRRFLANSGAPKDPGRLRSPPAIRGRRPAVQRPQN